MNGGDPFDFPNPFPFPDFSRPPGEGNKRRGGGGRDVRGRRDGRRGLLIPPLPAPIGVIINPGAVPTFPRLPQPGIGQPPTIPRLPTTSPDAFPGIGKIFKVGVVVVNVAIILDEIIRRAQENRINREQRERDAADRRAAQRSGADNPMRIVIIDAPLPDPVVDPRRILLPRVPAGPDIPLDFPLEIPAIRLPSPEILPEIMPEIPTIPKPSVSPATSPATSPAAIPGFGVPRPLTLPAPPPILSPVRFPFGDPLAFPQAKPFPRVRPVGDPFPELARPLPDPVRPLTGIDPAGVSSRIAEPLFLDQPQADPSGRTTEKECQEVKRRRRKKGKCREGFFRERPGSTRFITWRENDCN